MKKLKEILLEIGNSTKARPWIKSAVTKLEPNFVDRVENVVSFRTAKHTVYNVILEYLKLGTEYKYSLSVSFKVSGGDYDDRTNKFEIFSVLATVSDIVAHAIKRNGKHILFIKFIPVKTENDHKWAYGEDTQRGKLYLAFINNKLTSMGIKYKIESIGNAVKVYLL